jgi:GDP-4-dehydro-6-deoxy-D-mannose reductase
VGSAAEVGSRGAAQLPVTEQACCRPETPYGQSKWEVTRLALAEPDAGPLQIIVARPFNLVGPGLSSRLSLGSFAQQIAAAARGESVEIRCGPLDTRRDFVDVRDAVQAYVALAERGRAGHVYNVCAGRSYRIGDLLERLIALGGVRARVVSEASQARPGDMADIYGDHAKITLDVAWKPTVAIERSLADLLAAA